MAEYVDVGGVRTWVERRGAGESTIVLLHGGLGSSDDLLESIGGPLAEQHRVLAFDRRGHGRTPDTAAPFHYEDMAEHAIGLLEGEGVSRVHLVGWSDGGIVAMLIALRRPDLVDRLVLIGVNFHFDGIHPLDVSEDSPVAAVMLAEYAERSPDGPEHFAVVARKFQQMITSEPTLTAVDVSAIRMPCLVLVGDDDLVRLEHTVALYQALPAGQLCVVPAASHIVVLERPERVAAEIEEFLARPEPPVTMAPIRRAGRRAE